MLEKAATLGARHPRPEAPPLPAAPFPRFLERNDRNLVLALAALYAAGLSFLCVRKFDHYLYTDFDLAIFAQALDQMLRGSLFSSIRGMNWLGDHSSLILFPLLPLYAIFRHPVTLLVVQSVALAAGAIPVRWLARRETGSGAVAVGCAALYLLHPALGYVNLFEFHPEALSTSALLFAFYYLRAGRTLPLVIWAGLSLLGKEDVALVVAAMALYALADRAQPRRFRHAAALAALAVASLALTLLVLKPLNAGQADYGAMYRPWGSSAGEVIRGMLGQPALVLQHLVSTPASPFDSLLKREYYLHLLLPVAFLPLASPLTLLIAAPVAAAHLLSWRREQHVILFQYGALVIPFVIAAAVLGLGRLARLVAWWGAGARRPPRQPGGRSRKAGRGRARPAVPTGRAGRPAAGAALALVALALGSAVASQWLFGPVFGTGRMQAMKSPQAVTPSPLDRTAKPHRDALLAGLPEEGGVVASFEFLAHLSGRSDVHSLHHVLLGAYTFSNRPYPVPTGIAALVADAGLAGTAYADLESAARLRRLRAVNRLAPVARRGTLLLMRRDAPDTVALAAPATPPLAHRRGIVFDGGLELVASDATPGRATPGAEITVRTDWRRTGALDRLYAASPALLGPRGREIRLPAMNLASMFEPAHEWPADSTVRVVARALLPLDLRPGRHELALRVLWLGRDGRTGLALPGDPAMGARPVALGAIEVVARPRPHRGIAAARRSRAVVAVAAPP